MPGDITYDLIRKTLKLSSFIGYRMQVDGQENISDNLDLFNGRGAVFAANHESVIDAFLLGLTVPPDLSRVYFLGKKSALWRNRYWGRMMDYFGVIPVNDSRQKNKRSNKLAIRKGIEVLEKKQALGIFPEGHIKYSRKALEGKVGVARFAFETDSPVIPVGIIGTDGLLPYGGNWPSLGKKVILSIGEPVFLDDFDKNDILNYSALRAATDLIMSRIRLLSYGYGIHPYDASNLSCMRGINRILVPEHVYKSSGMAIKKKKNDVATRFDNWLTDIDITTRNEKRKNHRSKTPPVAKTAEKFIEWLDDQL
ncbi:MAG: lysophospholipid acyltransferase family protein [Candidatus Hodarchaeales archaeon]